MTITLYTVDPTSIVPSMPQDIDHLVVKWDGLWRQEGGKTVVAFKHLLDRDGFERELLAMERDPSPAPKHQPLKGLPDIGVVEAAVLAVREAENGIYWMREHGDTFVEGALLEINKATGRPGFREAEAFLSRAFKNALPGILSAALTMAAAQNVAARASLREEGPKV